MNMNVIIGNDQSPETLSRDILPWRISRGRLAATLIFFDGISYYSGYVPKEVVDRLSLDPSSHDTARLWAPYWKLSLPNDPALNFPNLGLVVPFFSTDPYVSMAQATVEKMEDGYQNARGERWVCHPRILRTDAAALNSHPFAPSINLDFLDGLVCPPDNTPLENVLSFKEKRQAERQAFFDALYRHCDAIEIDGKILSVNIDRNRIEKALRDLSRSMPQRWIDGIKRSFQFEVRLSERTVEALILAGAAFATGSNAGHFIAGAVLGAISYSASLTPRLRNEDEFTKAMGFVLGAKSTFNP